jgi:hypothetical protein
MPTHQYRSPLEEIIDSVGVPEASPAYLAAIVAVVGARQAVINWARIPTYVAGSVENKNR